MIKIQDKFGVQDLLDKAENLISDKNRKEGGLMDAEKILNDFLVKNKTVPEVYMMRAKIYLE